MSKTHVEIETIRQHLHNRGILASFVQVSVLRRAERTLHRWAEAKCGDSDSPRYETTGKPYREYHSNNSTASILTAIPDRERGALKRAAAVCAELNVIPASGFTAAPNPSEPSPDGPEHRP